jgi:plasmid maintenance system antidote protein VapI
MEKIKETSQIIETILQFYRLNAKNFAEKIGTSPTQVYDLLKGKIKKLSPDMTEKILTAFPDISRFFLLTGDCR